MPFFWPYNTVNGNPVWQYLGYAQITSTFTTTNTAQVQVTGLSVTATVPANYTKVKVTAFCGSAYNASIGDGVTMTIWRGTVGSGTQVNSSVISDTNITGGVVNTMLICESLDTPGAGSVTYNVGLSAITGGTATLASTGLPIYLLVECC